MLTLPSNHIDLKNDDMLPKPKGAPQGRAAQMLGFVIFGLLIMGECALAKNEQRESTVCGVLKERLAFWAWRQAAGSSNAERALRFGNVTRINLTTGDGKSLRGYKAEANITHVNNQGPRALLVVQGNAMLADQLVDSMQIFAESGFDVYLYDYRGYGESDGKPRLKAIVKDYLEILDALRNAYQSLYVYGISFGGVVVMNAIGAGALVDGAVIDSSPSRVKMYGCPQGYDPIRHLPPNSSHFMFLSGGERLCPRLQR